MTESRFLDPEDEAFNDIERQARQRRDAVTAALENAEIRVTELKKRFDALSASRNETIEEVAQRFEKARDGCSPDDIMGRRWMDSAAELVRSMKK